MIRKQRLCHDSLFKSMETKRDISGKLIKCVHRIAHSNYSNKEIINGTISWSSTSEGSDYWFGLYVNTKK